MLGVYLSCARVSRWKWIYNQFVKTYSFPAELPNFFPQFMIFSWLHQILLYNSRIEKNFIGAFNVLNCLILQLDHVNNYKPPKIKYHYNSTATRVYICHFTS